MGIKVLWPLIEVVFRALHCLRKFEALKAMFLVENGSSGLGKRTNLSEIRPIRIEGCDPNVPIICPMGLLDFEFIERVNGAMD